MLKYKLKAIFGMKYKSFFNTIKEVHKKTGKSQISIFFDILNCAIKYGAGHNDYKMFDFYNMKPENRDTYLTRFRSKKIVEYLNDPKYRDIINDKSLFNEKYKDFLGRKTINANTATLDEFTSFINEHQTVFCKPPTGDSGKVIEKLSLSDFSSVEEFFNYVKGKGITVIESIIVQHPDLAKVNPYAVNCMRLVTIVRDDKTVDVAYGVIKFGCSTSFVDNMGFGAVSAPIDLKTGQISQNAETCKREVFEKHPISGITFKGFQIPLFDDAIELVKKAALVIPEIRQIGWDVCISENGPAIIEGNDWSDYMFWQLPEQTPDKIGLMPYYRKLLPELKI